MLPAKDELQHYADCVGAGMDTNRKAWITQTIKAMTPEQADAWMMLLQAAERVGGEYDYSRTDEDADEAQLN